jgi:5,10-methylenetetrahydromethanopterin reductase
MRLAINLGMFPPYMYPGCPEFTLADMVRAAQEAEALGVEMISMPEAPVYREAIVPLAAMAVATKEIRLATAVLPIGYRSPVITARSIAQLDELSGGRAILGLGIGVRQILARQGIATDRPVERLREYMAIVRRLLAGEEVTRDSPFHNLQGASLGFVPLRGHIPILLGAQGRRSLELAGEQADGVILGSLSGPSPVEWALQRIRAGAERAGRDLSSFLVAQNHVTCVHPSPEVARHSARHLLAYYLASPHRDRELTELGFLEDAQLVREELTRSGPQAASRKVTDAMVDAFTVWGTPQQCRATLEEKSSHGIQLHSLLPVGPSPHEAMGHLLELCREVLQSRNIPER